jgi:putative salt-induced outer membrane protein YdiY
MKHRIAKRLLVLAFAASAAVASSAHADEILLNNGDRLTGKITAAGSKLTIDTKAAGKVTVDLKDVKTFSTDEPTDLILKDGTHVHGRIESAGGGLISVAPGPAGAMAGVVPYRQLKAINPPAAAWSGSVLIGGLLARGNTDSDSLNATAQFSHKTDHDEFTFYGQYIFSRQRVPGDGKHETADDLLGRLKYQYDFTPRFYGYGAIEGEHDVIAGLDLRLAPTVGVGYKWFDEPAFGFNTEAGIGYLYRQYAHDGETGNPAARVAYHLKSKLNDKVSLYHDLEYLPGLDRLDDYFLDADLGIRTDITGKVYTEFKVDYRYDSKPAPGHGPNDLRFILGVGVAF